MAEGIYKYGYGIVALLAITLLVIAMMTMTDSATVDVDITGIEIPDSDWRISETVSGNYAIEMYAPQLTGNDVSAHYDCGSGVVVELTECVDEDGFATIVFPPTVRKIVVTPN